MHIIVHTVYWFNFEDFHNVCLLQQVSTQSYISWYIYSYKTKHVICTSCLRFRSYMSHPTITLKEEKLTF